MPSRQRKPSVAVVLATHNGERFLEDQLTSLSRQTRLPDELVVHDDCSIDATVELVEAFAQVAPFPVRVVRAGAHRGYRRAFFEAARMTRTDLVAFCDQDDVWRPHKLACCAAEFERRSDLALVVHSAALTGRDPTVGRAFPAYRRRRVANAGFAPIMPRTPGFAMVASRRVVDPWTIIGELGRSDSRWDHDDWTATIAAAVGAVAFLPDRLVIYRQHDANVWGAPASNLTDRLRVSMAYQGEEADVFRELASWAREHAALLRELDHWLQDRSPRLSHRGPLTQAAFWQRLAEATERRVELYGSKTRRPIIRTISRGAKGDYGPRAKGGLGVFSFGRDVLYTAGLLERLPRRAS